MTPDPGLVVSVALPPHTGIFGQFLIVNWNTFESGLAVSPVGLFQAAGFAIGIGLGAGVCPALKASRLHPVDATV